MSINALRTLLEEQTRLAFCSLMSTGDNLVNFARQIAADNNYYGHDELTAVSSFASLAGISCNISPAPIPTPTVPIGQCSTEYCIYVWVEGTTSSGYFTNGTYAGSGELCSYPGPLSEPYVSSQGTGFPHVFVDDANGNPVRFLNVNGVTITSLTPQHFRVDGLPDDCGVPTYGPYEIQPYEERPFIEREYELPDGGTGNSGWRFSIPFVGVGGAIIAPFELNGDFTLFGKLDLSDGEVKFDFGGDEEEQGGSAPSGTTEPPLPEDGEEKKEKMVGALVRVNSIDDNAGITRLYQDGNPDVLIPDAGLISFRVQVGRNFSYWTEDIKIKNEETFIPAPENIKVIDVRGTPRPGVDISLEQVFKTLNPLTRT